MTSLDRRGFFRIAMVAGTAAAGAFVGRRASACAFHDAAKTAEAPRSKSVAELARADFEPLVGTPFDINGRMLVLEGIRREPLTTAQGREPFSLVFESGKANGLESGIMPVRHPAIGKAELFVTVVHAAAGATAEIRFT